jgi:uncharacterized hydrophobic protein (TIGR00341 family)
MVIHAGRSVDDPKRRRSSVIAAEVKLLLRTPQPARHTRLKCISVVLASQPSAVEIGSSGLARSACQSCSGCQARDHRQMLTMPASLIPPQQRKSLGEVSDQLYLMRGDTQSKLSAYWTMLVLSAVIAAAGVLADSTATVIGAMIIAPLSTPIMGVAIAIVEGDGRRLATSAMFVLGGGTAVVLIGALASLGIPQTADLAANSQITGRTSPNLVDLVAAIATGFAGAVALSRRDVGDVLPGVAIAISLVPPLAVVGVTAGDGSFSLAAGALVLFLSNVVALVLAGTLTFTAAGYAADSLQTKGFSRRRAYFWIATTALVVSLPLAANTAGNILVMNWTADVRRAADDWLAPQPDASVIGVQVHATRAVVRVRATADIPPPAALLRDLEGEVPDGVAVQIEVDRGASIEAGVVGQ